MKEGRQADSCLEKRREMEKRKKLVGCAVLWFFQKQIEPKRRSKRREENQLVWQVDKKTLSTKKKRTTQEGAARKINR